MVGIIAISLVLKRGVLYPITLPFFSFRTEDALFPDFCEDLGFVLKEIFLILNGSPV